MPRWGQGEADILVCVFLHLSQTGMSGAPPHLHQTLNASNHPVRNRLLRITTDSPELLAVIKQEGAV